MTQCTSLAECSQLLLEQCVKYHLNDPVPGMPLCVATPVENYEGIALLTVLFLVPMPEQLDQYCLSDSWPL